LHYQQNQAGFVSEFAQFPAGGRPEYQILLAKSSDDAEEL
jgi:hypothetical protein